MVKGHFTFIGRADSQFVPGAVRFVTSLIRSVSLQRSHRHIYFHILSSYRRRAVFLLPFFEIVLYFWKMLREVFLWNCNTDGPLT